jgi:hypothetical protein
MDKRFPYEKPMLVDLRDDLSCKGASCGYGSDISAYSCGAGSCEPMTGCENGSKAEVCCNGTAACSTDYWGTCGTGSGVTACGAGASGGTYSTTCDCSTGAQAGRVCSNGTLALGMGCGCGSNNGT